MVSRYRRFKSQVGSLPSFSLSLRLFSRPSSRHDQVTSSSPTLSSSGSSDRLSHLCFFRFSPSSPVSPSFLNSHLPLLTLLVHSAFITQPSLHSPELLSLLADSSVQLNMFNRLPPELVRQIVESTVPSTYHSSTYGERQRLLRCLCLVRRLFRDIAQSLLRQVVVIPFDKISHAHSVIDEFTEPPRQIVAMVPTPYQLLALAISNGSIIRNLTINVGLGRLTTPLPIQHFVGALSFALLPSHELSVRSVFSTRTSNPPTL